MKNQPAALFQKREVFILRLWPKSPQGTIIVELQNVSTGKVTHLSDLEAIADYLRMELQMNHKPEENRGG